MTLKERLRARGAPKLQWAFALLAAWAFFVEVRPNFPDVDRPMKNRRSQLPKKCPLRIFNFGAPRALRRSLCVALAFRFSVPARTDCS